MQIQVESQFTCDLDEIPMAETSIILILLDFLREHADRWKAYKLEVKEKDVWCQVLQAEFPCDWDLNSKLCDLELEFARSPLTKDICCEFSVVPCWIPRGYEA